MQEKCRVRINIKYKEQDVTIYMEPEAVRKMTLQRFKRIITAAGLSDSPETNRANWADGTTKEG